MSSRHALYHSCAFCARLVLDLDRKHPPLNADQEPDPPPKEEVIFFDATLRDISQSANSCKLCDWLLSAWTSNYPGASQVNDSRKHLCATTYSTSLTDRFPLDEISHFLLWDIDRPYDANRWGRAEVITTEAVDLLACHGDPAAEFILNRPISDKTWSSTNAALARKWLDECVTKHKGCMESTSSYMPKRVLRLSATKSGDVFQVQLLHPTQVEPFAVLSYCWGGDQPHKTTEARMKSSANPDIPWSELPRTVQHAVRVTIDLGLSYLWVDSLCIVQDSKQDILSQIPEMTSIYGGASVTIVASRASRAVDGFLDDITVHRSPSLAVKLFFRGPGRAATGTALLTVQEGSRAPEPLDHRAWAFQEYYMSHRTLSFATRQMRWECPSSRHQPGFTNGWKHTVDADNSPLQVINMRHDTEQMLQNVVKYGLGDDAKDALYRQAWHSVVLPYTTRLLTFPTDRILAVSGISKLIGATFHDDYLAGHWRRFLPADLLWHVLAERRELAVRPKEYQGPSWAWTGVNGAVNFRFDRTMGRKTRMQLVECTTGLEDPSALYGSVKAGQVALRSRVREALWFGSASSTGAFNRLEQVPADAADCGTREFRLASVFPDAIEDEFLGSESLAGKPIEVHLLEAGVAIGLKKRGPVAIMLRRKPAVGTVTADHIRYSRLGLVHIDEKLVGRQPADMDSSTWRQITKAELGFFDNCEPQTIIIE